MPIIFDVPGQESCPICGGPCDVTQVIRKDVFNHQLIFLLWKCPFDESHKPFEKSILARVKPRY